MNTTATGLSGRVAIVTGAGSGIGRAAALRLAVEGVSVVVVDVDERSGRDTVGQIESASGRGLFVRADVAVEADVERAVADALATFGRIDILLNNAGVVAVAPVAETTEAEWDRLIDKNLKGAFLMAKHVIPHLAQSEGGVIINTASDAGLVGFANLGAYCASKGGIIQLTRALAVELGSDQIRVNAVAPTSTLQTGMVDRLFESVPDSQTLHRALADAHPLQRLGTAEEVAELMVFLASDRAAYMSGGIIPIDGGITAACPVPEF